MSMFSLCCSVYYKKYKIIFYVQLLKGVLR
jgi:hypothetical protein